VTAGRATCVCLCACLARSVTRLRAFPNSGFSKQRWVPHRYRSIPIAKDGSTFIFADRLVCSAGRWRRRDDEPRGACRVAAARQVLTEGAEGGVARGAGMNCSIWSAPSAAASMARRVGARAGALASPNPDAPSSTPSSDLLMRLRLARSAVAAVRPGVGASVRPPVRDIAFMLAGGSGTNCPHCPDFWSAVGACRGRSGTAGRALFVCLCV
jgi:hypothetical protein